MLLPDDEKISIVHQILKNLTEDRNYPVSDEVKEMVMERQEAYRKDTSRGLTIEQFKQKMRELNLRYGS